MTDRVAAVQRMQDHIAAHIEEEITLAALSAAAHFSPWYAHRLFREETGLSPAEYIRKLRLSMAAKRLKSGCCRITDAAFDLGFGSVDGFTRAFSREFGVTPGAYRLHPVPIPLFIPYGVKFREARKEAFAMENVKTVFVREIVKPAHKVIIKRGIKADDYMSYCEEVGCDIWGTLTSMDSLAGEPVCLWLPERYIAPGTSEYVQGVEVDAAFAGPIPDGFDVIALPTAAYLEFRGEPFDEEDYIAAIEAVQTAMDRYDPAAVGYAWDDANPRIQLEPRGERGYIELRAVRAV